MESIHRYKFQALEIILVDGGSPNNTCRFLHHSDLLEQVVYGKMFERLMKSKKSNPPVTNSHL